MKKILALAAVAALTAGVSAYAANPFSDVTPDDWALPGSIRPVRSGRRRRLSGRHLQGRKKHDPLRTGSDHRSPHG